MSFLAYLPGAKSFAKSAGKRFSKIEQNAEALHNAFMPVTVRDEETDYDEPQTRGAKVIEQFRAQVQKGIPLTMNIQGLTSLVDALKHSKGIDDRKMLLEHVLVFMSRLPDGDLANKLQDEVIQILFYDLPHPPATYMGDFKWRTADGSGNNVSVPDMGRAGMPYSRSVQASHALVPSELPDPELIYHALLKRDKFVPHPAGLSSLMFGFAALVIHSIFRTSFIDWSINETSSYIDLAPLYGNDQATQDAVRLKDGRGRLHPDVFAEDRLLLLPPASAAILVLFNRNHIINTYALWIQYIVQKILEINERGTFVDPSTLAGKDAGTTKKRLAQDDELFNTARLVNCTWFAQVVFSDYFASILGLVRDGSSWNLNPFSQMRKADHSMVERGQGNSVSVEFNLLYRWHPTLSEADAKWTEGVFGKLFEGKPFDKITVQDFGRAMRQVQATENKDPGTWTFGGIQRGTDGSFKDDDLARILQDATSHPASAFKARGTPEVMRIMEILGIEQARKWGTCSLNDFRRFLQLKPYGDFEEWNPDPEIAQTARHLYGNIERLELYPGLQAEEPKPVVPGAGLCPPYTTSRAILADAISLCRGDRFYTADFTPWNLTAWGFQDCQRNPTNAGFGSMLGRLLLRTLPFHYPHDSSFTWFGLMRPDAMQEHLTRLGVAERYNFARPTRTLDVMPVDTYAAMTTLLRDRSGGFRTPYVERTKELIQGTGYLLSLDDPVALDTKTKFICGGLGEDPDAIDAAARLYFSKTRELIASRSYTLSGNSGKCIDIVDQVLNVVPLHFVSTALAGFPLKTKERPHGTYKEQELMQMLREVFAYIFFGADPAKRMRARELAKTHAEELLGHIKGHLKDVSVQRRASIRHSLIGIFNGSADDQSIGFLKRLSTSHTSKDEIAIDVLSVTLFASVEFAQALVNVVNMYLKDEYAEHKAKIVALSVTAGAEADAQLEGYVREALRLDPSVRGVFRYAQRDGDVNGVKVLKDQPLYLSFANANVDPEGFPNPTQIDPSRPAEKYTMSIDPVYGVFGGHFIEKTIAQVLRVVFRLKNLRRGPGQSGTLKRVVSVEYGTKNYRYLDMNRELSPWARSMILEYDDE